MKNVSQPRSGKTCCAYRSLLPLNSRHLRTVQSASVARTFQSIDDRMNWQFCQLWQREGAGFVDFSAYTQSPVFSVELDGFVHMIANKEVRYRREPAIEILNRRFKIEESLGSHDHPVFAGKVDRA